MTSSPATFEYIGSIQANLLARSRVKNLGKLKTLVSKPNGTRAEHEEAIDLIELHRLTPKVPYAVFVGFRIKYNGQWWEVTEAGLELEIKRLGVWGSHRMVRRIPRTLVEDVRCGPGFRFVMLAAPEGHAKPWAGQTVRKNEN